jgi:hypothetical protein
VLYYPSFRFPAFPLGTHVIYTILKSTQGSSGGIESLHPDSIWRNRDCFLQGTDAIIAFLTDKWEKEQGYRLRKELFAWTGNKIAVQVCRFRLDATCLRGTEMAKQEGCL